MSISTTDVKTVIGKLCQLIIDNEQYFCELDSAAGDGDFGMSLAKGFREVQKEMGDMDDSSTFKFLRGCGMIISEYCGGASGPIWGSAFNAAASSVKGKDALEIGDVAGMFESAVEAIQKRGGAKVGDKTLLDALIPATEALRTSADAGSDVRAAFEAAAAKAEAGYESTKSMIASRGRASYLGERSIGHPDAGATAISILFNALVKA
jgi:dihydroxyacetone kinase